jgi:hypothetical protein
MTDYVQRHQRQGNSTNTKMTCHNTNPVKRRSTKSNAKAKLHMGILPWVLLQPVACCPRSTREGVSGGEYSLLVCVIPPRSLDEVGCTCPSTTKPKAHHDASLFPFFPLLWRLYVCTYYCRRSPSTMAGPRARPGHGHGHGPGWTGQDKTGQDRTRRTPHSGEGGRVGGRAKSARRWQDETKIPVPNTPKNASERVQMQMQMQQAVMLGRLP